MKLSICGKGGSGKSSVSAMIAGRLKNMGYRVLVVDADESNFGLHRLVGAPLPVNVMDQIGGKKGFQEKMAALRALPEGAVRNVFGEKWDFDAIPDGYAAQADGLRLMLVGKIHDFAEGCACPMGALSKMLLGNIVVSEREAVIVDTEAGIEHFGRGLEGECDAILVVVDPTFESFEMAKKLEEMAKKAHKPAWAVLNKVNDDIEKTMLTHLDSIRVIGKIPDHRAIFTASLEGAPLRDQLPEIDEICRFLIDHVPCREE